jgi:hypothetical protein
MMKWAERNLVERNLVDMGWEKSGMGLEDWKSREFEYSLGLGAAWGESGVGVSLKL